MLGCLAGGAQLHSRENLEAIGGRIDTSSLAEDTVTTFRTQLGGRRVEFEGNAIVWAEEPSDLTGLWKQRMRWARGNLQVSLQFLSIWGKQRSTFGNLARAPFLLLWFTVLLMPLTMVASSAALFTLFALNSNVAWAVLRLLWIWAAVSYAASVAMSLAIDWRTARACWREAVMFPGAIALVMMLYSAYPPLFDTTIVTGLAHMGILITPHVRAGFALFMYAWLILCVPLAYLAKMCGDSASLRWLAPALVYVVGYGPYLCAVTFGSYVNELVNVGTTWEKTTKVGRVMLSAGGQR
ncbi:MAG TPA: glycosyltransferase family 2 protein [Gemmatimonadaceae bacterium]|nr:glycosyltransferase family 2 protein [Gemmatimonadaceae bacterium]